MNNTTKVVFIAGIGLVLLVLWLSSLQANTDQLFGGLFFFYMGALSLFQGIRKEGATMAGLKFRLIAGGSIALIGGLVSVISFFS